VRVVGLTGGIGSGKSTVAALLRDRGLPVVDADLVARICTAAGSPVLAGIAARFGPAVLTADGGLDRSALAGIVFSDPSARRDLEALVHPCIAAGIDDALAVLAAGDPPPDLVVVEHPLLVETGGAARVDTVVVVEAPLEVRVARTVAGRGLTEPDVRARAAAQVDDVARRAVADHVLVNDGDAAALAGAVDALLRALGAEGSGRARTPGGGA
jgi:dephospho-CoA kinase